MKGNELIGGCTSIVELQSPSVHPMTTQSRSGNESDNIVIQAKDIQSGRFQ